MIRRVRLENWRAYRQLDLTVGPGVTFLVAANGVGKSSLLEAVRWALSPDYVQSDLSVIRHGHNEATATVTLMSPRGELEVRRIIRENGNRGSSRFDVKLNGQELLEAEFKRLLSDLWSADLAFVSKTAFLTEGLHAEHHELDLRNHLCHIYSLDEFQRALAEIHPALTQANRGVKTARAELTATEEQLTTAKRERADLEKQLQAGQAEVSAARDRLAYAQRAAEQALAAQRLKATVAAWDDQNAALHRDIAWVTNGPSDKDAIPEVLHHAKLSVREELDAAKAEQARLSARLESVAEGLASLRAAGGQCPVCLRGLDDDSRQRAEHLHSQELTEIQERLQAVNPEPLIERLNRVETLELRAATLGERPSAEATGSLDAPDANVAPAQAILERAVSTLAEVEVAVRSADQRIDRITAELAEAEHVKRRYREVALLEAAEKAINSTISSVLGEQLIPLTREVNLRWRSVFPDRPNLILMPDGTMSRDVGGSPLAFTAFSAGEKMVAKLMMCLTTLLVTTTVPFCWVDEPLEHLDPRNRHLVGSMLAHLGNTPDLEQIFVTTYEEPLARRLAESHPSRVRVEYLRTEQVS